ncbi:penicillin-binding protein 1A [Allopseudospirillum japonicum]|uniref:Penicillin-binding protein 1A n=1 Tax=Allopseudospirillum japonicum TaxID=64971 RepID=A0A1H6R8P1_9GAMM|nr:penicillin-binding protein 1A [Allopseudospirillum japonicum]SEI47995.1 penicillin-binding protein 1A [Allopseudospirillum japonicum]
MKIMRTFFHLLGLGFLAALAGGSCLVLAVALYYWPGLQEEVAKLRDLDQLLAEQLEVPLRVYSRDHKLIAEFGEQRRKPIQFQQIPPDYIKAILAAEDANFFQHPGIDPKALARAAVQLGTTGHIQSGGSTISMQVARNYLLTLDRTFTRKIREILLSLQMERLLTKQQIMELYVNKIYLGHRSYGIAAAAEVYYGKPLAELNLAQLAMIAGLPKAPSAYNPLTNPKRALIRRNWILSRMLDLGFIDAPRYSHAVRQPVSARYHSPKPELEAPYIAEMARTYAVERWGKEAYTKGLSIYTSIDSQQQAWAQHAMVDGLIAYDRRHGWRGVEQEEIPASLQIEDKLDAEAMAELKATRGLGQDAQGSLEAALQDPRARVLQQSLGQDVSHWLKVLDQTLNYGGLIPAIVTQVEEKSAQVLIASGELVTLDWDAMKWAGRYRSPRWHEGTPKDAHQLLKVGDMIRLWKQPQEAKDDPQAPAFRWQLAQIPSIQGALVAINPNTGAIEALMGGFDFYHSKFNRATQAERQAGSIFKPFIYSAALAKGYTAATLINDAPFVLQDVQLEDVWRPQNSSGKFYGPTRLREGLYKSRNLISIRVLDYVGIGPALDYLQKFGFETNKLPANLSLALGSANVTPLQMASAYAVLANGGYAVAPYFIERIQNAQGEVIFQAQPKHVCRACTVEHTHIKVKGQIYPVAERVLDEYTAYIMHSILQDVIRRGTGRRALELERRDLAGKTGTTNDQRDAWFSGFNTEKVVTVWTGFDQNTSTAEYGAQLALPIWMDFMRFALAQMPPAELEAPADLVRIRIDANSGLRARAESENTLLEVFRPGRVPAWQPNAAATGMSTGGGLVPVPESLF